MLLCQFESRNVPGSWSAPRILRHHEILSAACHSNSCCYGNRSRCPAVESLCRSSKSVREQAEIPFLEGVFDVARLNTCLICQTFRKFFLQFIWDFNLLTVYLIYGSSCKTAFFFIQMTECSKVFRNLGESYGQLYRTSFNADPVSLENLDTYPHPRVFLAILNEVHFNFTCGWKSSKGIIRSGVAVTLAITIKKH